MEEGEITSRDLTEEELLEIKNRRLDNKVIGEKLDNGGVVVSDSFAKTLWKGNPARLLMIYKIWMRKTFVNYLETLKELGS